MWDTRVVGKSVTFKKNPNYWQKGKPYLDKVTWTYVTEDNTRELQLQGNQIQVDEFPPFNSIDKLQNTPGREDEAVPVDAHGLPGHQRELRAARRRARAPGDRLRDRPDAIVKSVLFGHGQPANSFMPPQVPFYDKSTPGLKYDMAKAKEELAQSAYPQGFKVEMLVGSGRPDREPDRADPPAGAQAAGHQHHVQDRGHRHGVPGHPEPQVPARLLLLDDGHRRPGRAGRRSRSTPKAGGAHSFFTDYNNPKVVSLSHQAEHNEDPAKRQKLYSQIQSLAAHDAFLPPLYYSPFRYATATTSTASWSIRSATTTSRTSGSDEPVGGTSPGACWRCCRSRWASRSWCSC